MTALIADTRPLPRTSIPYTTGSIAAAALARQPVLWPQASSASREWRAHHAWAGDEALAALIPWAVARLDEKDGEFVLTAPTRAGDGQSLLHAAPAWEPLRPPTRNVTIATILTADQEQQQRVQQQEQRRQQQQQPQRDGYPAVEPPTAADSAANAPRAQHYYYSGSLGQDTTAHWQTAAIMDGLSPLAPLEISDAPPLAPESSPQPPAGGHAGGGGGASSLPKNKTSLRLWLTSANVMARAHYDKGHNVLCVLRGRKQFVLWPPSELPSLHLYPAVHVAHRQSQVSAMRLDSVRRALAEAEGEQPAEATSSGGELFARTTPALRGVVGEYALLDPKALLGMRGAWRAEVSAGECLYTPPYWGHSVYSPEPSVALAAFSTSWEQARWARSGWLMAPLGRFVKGGICSKSRGAALLISAFVHACAPVLDAATPADDVHSPRAFLARVFAARFAPLYGSLHVAPTSAANSRSSLALSDCLSATPESLPPDAPELDTQLLQRVRAFASSVAALLTETDPSAIGGPRAFSPGVAAELAADYVEELAGWACGADGAWRLLRLLALTEEMDVQHGASS